MQEHEPQVEKEINFRDLFVPFTDKKAIVFIFILSLCVFVNSFLNPFQLDDFTQIVNSSAVQHLQNIPAFYYVGMSYMRGDIHNLLFMQYRPLDYTVYTIIYSLFGSSSFPFHILQFLIHTANTVLIFFLFSKFIKRKLSFLLSLVFLVHPINNEAVIYISDLQDVLFVLFGLVALTFIVYKSQDKLSFKKLLLIGSLLLLSLLTKETGILFLMIILVYIIIFDRHNLKKIIFTLISTSLVYILLRYVASLDSVPNLSFSLMQRTPLFERLINIPEIVFYYFSKLFLPVHLAIAQDWIIRSINFQSVILPMLIDLSVFICIFCSGVIIFRKKRTLFNLYLFFSIWFVLGLGMHIQIMPLDVTVADRWFYFPMIGLLGMVGIIAHSLRNIFKRNPSFVAVAICIYTILLLFYSYQGIQRNSEWQSKLALYSHDVQYAGNSPLLYANYGGLLLASGNYDQAENYLSQSIVLDSQLSFNLNNLAVVYEHKKDYVRAKKLYMENIRQNAAIPQHISTAYCGLARIALLHDKNPEEAKRFSEEGLRQRPANTQILKFLALSEYQLGEKREALEVARELYGILPQQGAPLYSFIQNERPITEVDPLYGVNYLF